MSSGVLKTCKSPSERASSPPRRAANPLQSHSFWAFTIVELLVAMFIMAVLMALLLPVLGKVREQASRTACLSNLRVIGQSLVLYCNDYHDCLPNGNAPQTWKDNSGADQVMVDFNSAYARTPSLFWCPSSSQSNNTAIDNAEIGTVDQPSVNSARASYDFYFLYWAPEYGPKITTFKGQAPLAWDLNGGLMNLPNQTTDIPVHNHGLQGGNVLFADGHAEWQPRSEWDDGDWPHPADQFYPTLP